VADAQAEIGIIGGSGFYRMRGLEDITEVPVDTPFGPPSDAVLVGTLGGRRVAFLARHGRGHRVSPSELPARANIWALKHLGVQRLVSVSAVGSMREAIAPGHLGVPDQLIDRTVGRPRTFFSDGIVGHVAFAEPYCPALRRSLVAATRGAGTVHDGGALIIIEGPQFSTRAESELFRGWGTSYIGMTALPEARLAREAELCYATLALVTDYDCWHDSHETVSADLVVRTLNDVAARAAVALATLIPTLPAQSGAGCACDQALASAIVTAPEHISAAVRARLQPIIGKYVDEK
jgi:5'-methylthioadenosine phosphorylase